MECYSEYIDKSAAVEFNIFLLAMVRVIVEVIIADGIRFFIFT